MNLTYTMRLGLAALAFSAVAATAAHAECRPFKVTSAEMIGTTLDKAKRNARGAWERKVNRLDSISTGWNDWGNAIEHSYSCHKKLGTYRCKATARPCTRGGGGAPRMICDSKPTTGSLAKGVGLDRTRKEARGKWEKTAKANWGMAVDQKYDCRKTGNHYYRCNAIARKCWPA